MTIIVSNNVTQVQTSDSAAAYADRLLAEQAAAAAMGVVPGTAAIQRVTSIAYLRTITPDVSKTACVTGYYTDGDGGGGYFYAVTGAAAGTYVDNGGTVIVPNTGNGSSAWLRVKSDYLNVKWFGAKGDGVTDDSTALTTCVAVANVFGAYTRVIRVPSGRYKFSTTLALSVGVSLIGDASQDGTANFQTVLEYYGTGWAITTYSNLIKNIDLKSKVSGQSGIFILGGLTGVCENVNIIDFTETGMRIGDAAARVAGGNGGASYAQNFNSICIATNTAFSKIAFLIDGGLLPPGPNSNANFLSNIYISGKWKTFADIRGNANQINSLTLELFQGNPEDGWIDTGVNLRGLNNVLATPYLERFPTSAALENRTQVIRFSNQWTPIAFKTNPIDGDTITITGYLGSPAAVTVTFRAIPVATTDVQIGVDVSATMANLVTLINASANPTLASISASVVLDSVAAYEIMLELRTNEMNQWSISSVSSAFKTNASSWTRSVYNRITDAYIPYVPYGIAGSVYPGGAYNNVNTGYGGSQFGQNISYSSLISNADLKILNASNVPVGWVVTSGGAFGGTVTRTTTKTRNSPYCLEMTCAATRGQAAFSIYTATVANQQLNQIPLDYLKGMDITIGIWCWSDTAGFGNIQVFNGLVASAGPSHSGLGRWELLYMSYHVSTAATALQLRITNSAANVASTGTCYFCAPAAYFGIIAPQDNNIRLLNDSDAAMAGRMSWNPPQDLSVDSATPSAANGNFFTEKNTVATTITNFTDGRAGQEIKILTTTTNTTLKNNTTIVTTTGADKALSAGVIYKLIYDGSKWREY